MNKLVFLCALTFSSFSYAYSSDNSEQSRDGSTFSRSLKVAVVAEEDPISEVDEQGKPYGMAVEIWEKITNDLGWKNQYTILHDRVHALEELETKDYDVLLGPFQISHGIGNGIDYSIPYFINSIGIVSRDSNITIETIVKELNTGLLDASFFYTFILFFIFSFALYISERKKHPDLVGKGVMSGLGNSMWAIVSTFLRDLVYTPATTFARTLMSLWMICSVIFMTVIASSITASILNISSKVVTEYKTAEDLYGKKVGVIKGSHSEFIAYSMGGQVVHAEHEKELLELLHDHKVEAVIEDKVIAQGYINQHPELHVHLTKATLGKDMFAFVFKTGNDIRVPVNRKLSGFQEHGDLKNICSKYLQANIEDCTL